MANSFQRSQLSQKEEEKFRILDNDRRQLLTSLISSTYKIDELDELIMQAVSEDLEQQYRGYVGMRMLISVQNPPIHLYILKGIVPLLPANVRDNPQLHLETLRIFTFIASGTEWQSASLIRQGVLPFMIDSIISTDYAISLEAIWTMANLLGDSDQTRKICIRQGVIDILLEQLGMHLQSGSKQHYASIIWALSNICRGKPLQPFNTVKPIISAFTRIFQQLPLEDVDMIEELAWSMCNFIELEEAVREEFKEQVELRKLVEALELDQKRINIPFMMILQQLINFSQTYGLVCLQEQRLLVMLRKFLEKQKVTREITIATFTLLFQKHLLFLSPVLDDRPLMTTIFNILQAEREEHRVAIALALQALLKHPSPLTILQMFVQYEIIKKILLEIDNLNEQTLDPFFELLYDLLVVGERHKDEDFNIIELDLLNYLNDPHLSLVFEKFLCSTAPGHSLDIYYRIHLILNP